MASIRKRGKSYQVQIRRKGLPDITASFTNKTLALEWVRKTEYELDRGIYLGKTETTHLSVKEGFERFSEGRRYDDVERRRIKTLTRHLGELQISKLTLRDLVAYRDTRLETIQPNTLKREITILSSMLNLAQSEWGVNLPNGNPCSVLKLPRFNDARTRRISPEEEALILEKLASKPIYRDIVLLHYTDLETLQIDLDAWLLKYNTERTHQGKMCCGRTPLETLVDGKHLWKEKNLG